jgi:WD40 repeat protein
MTGLRDSRLLEIILLYLNRIGHTAQISAIRFSKHSPSTLWSSSGDGTVRMWDLRAGTQVASYAPNNGRLYVRGSLLSRMRRS